MLNRLLVGSLLLAGVGLLWTPFDPVEQAFREQRLVAFQWPHLMGVDGLGRDYLSRLWSAWGHSVGLASLAVFINLLLANSLLALEIFLKPVAPVIQGLTSIWLGLPVLFLSLILLVFLPPSAGTLVVAVGLGNVPMAYRQLRSLWQEHSSALYVKASRALGGSRGHLLLRVIFPNLRYDLFALLKLLFAMSVLELSGLAFLGLIGDPDFPELGAILRQNQAYLFQNQFLLFWPGILLTGTLLLVHLSRNRADG